MRNAQWLHRVSFVLTAIFVSGPTVFGADALPMLDKFLDSSAGRAKSGATSRAIEVPHVPVTIVKPATQSTGSSEVAPLRESARVAQARRAVLRLSDENSPTLADPISRTVDPVSETIDSAKEAKISAAAKQAESAIDRKMQSMQRSLEREEKQLGTRLSELGRQRELALEKSDEKKLQRIETLEKNAVTDYEKRVNRILASMSAPQNSARPVPIERAVGSQRSNARTVPAPARTRASSAPVGSSVRQMSPAMKRPAPRPQPKPKQEVPARRRFRLWPFK